MRFSRFTAGTLSIHKETLALELELELELYVAAMSGGCVWKQGDGVINIQAAMVTKTLTNGSMCHSAANFNLDGGTLEV